jgi:hypothetical protein
MPARATHISYESIISPISGLLPPLALRAVTLADADTEVLKWQCSGTMNGKQCNRTHMFFTLPMSGLIFKKCERCGKPNVLLNGHPLL